MRRSGAAPRRRRTSRAYQSAGAPGGREPDRTAQWRAPALSALSALSDGRAAATASRSAISTASISSGLSEAPGSLSLVVVPSGSVTAVLTRAGAATVTARVLRTDEPVEPVEPVEPAEPAEAAASRASRSGS